MGNVSREKEMSINFYPKTECESEYFICGMCSNIPTCCIAFYKDYVETLQYHSQEDILKFIKSNNLQGFNYVPCEACYDSLRSNIINKCKESICVLPPHLKVFMYQPD